MSPAVALMMDPIMPSMDPPIMNHLRLWIEISACAYRCMEEWLPKDITESADEGQTKAATKGLDDGNQRVVWIWAEICVDDSDGVGGQHVS